MTVQLILVSNGEPVGSLSTDTGPDGLTRIVYEVDNNGRGARLTETLRMESGLPVLWEVDGTSLMGGTVQERFAIDSDGAARWSSQADEGATTAPGFYLPADASPYGLVLLVERALATGGPVPLLPAGEITVAPVPLGAVGGRDLDAFALSGVQLRPQYVLRDHATGELLGISDGELLLHPDLVGAAAVVDAALQSATRTRFAALSHEATMHESGPLVVRDVRIFDPVSGDVGDPQTIVVDGRTISAIGHDIAEPDGATIIEGAGRIALPGLHDMHAHLDTSSALLYIAAGVTSVRDMGNDNDALAALMTAIDAGEVRGPSVVPAGFIEGRSAHAMRMGHVVESLDEALAAVDWYADRGFHAIKIYNSFTPDWVAATAARAHERGMRVQGHVPAFMDADRAIADGYDEITHLNQLALGWVLEPEEDTRTPLRLTALTRVADLDLDSERVQRTITSMVERGVSLDVTLVILEQLMLSRARTVIPAHEPVIEHFPAGVRRYRRRTYVPYRDQAELDSYETAFRRLQEIVVRLHQKGVKLWPGTDDGTGVTVHRELELFVDAGISPVDTLRIATIACADHLHRKADRGTIEVGKAADFILVDGDPTRSIRDIRNVALTVAEGRAVSPARIYRGFGMVPFAAEPALTT
ncbi:MAG: amidohydrolase [Microbacterium sp.]|nr:amidohydrolase [Microbacterium sp.]